jgi:hypothetical protein
MEKSCLDCLYANYSLGTLMIQDLSDHECMKCEHQNSPYFEEVVDERRICRLFIDEKEYFFNKDRVEKIKELKSKMKFKRR